MFGSLTQGLNERGGIVTHGLNPAALTIFLESIAKGLVQVTPYVGRAVAGYIAVTAATYQGESSTAAYRGRAALPGYLGRVLAAYTGVQLAAYTGDVQLAAQIVSELTGSGILDSDPYDGESVGDSEGTVNVDGYRGDVDLDQD